LKWSCATCTFENHELLQLCEICGGKRLVLETKRAPTIPNQTLNNDGIVQSIADVLVLSFSSNPDKNGVKGILRGMSKGQTIQCRVSDPLCNFYSQRGQFGAKWSCGYRNIQMLCSSLMKLPEYRAVLFDGDGRVPDVVGLQRWIERAWHGGFDSEGAVQLGGRLEGTSKWIGATECAALLRYFGVRARVVDFAANLVQEEVHSSNGSPGDEGVLRAVQRWLTRYYQLSESLPSSSSSRPSEEGFRPPLFLQHSGHSRTVFGATTPSNTNTTSVASASPWSEFCVLLLDPSCEEVALRRSLQQANLQWLLQIRKPLSKLYYKGSGQWKKGPACFQIVYVAQGLVPQGSSEWLTSQTIHGLLPHQEIQN